MKRVKIEFNKNNKILILLLVLFFITVSFFVYFLISIETTEIFLYYQKDEIVFYYQDNKYIIADEKNKAHFSTVLYNNYQKFLPTNYEKTLNTEWKRYLEPNYLFSYFIPFKVRVIYDENGKPIIIENKNYIESNDFYLIAEN